MISALGLRLPKKRTLFDALMALPFLIVGAAWLSRIPCLAPDWENFFRPGALALLNPYAIAGNYSPPWLYVALWPLAVLPDWLSKGALTLATLAIVRAFMGDTERFLWACATMPLFAVVAFGQVDAIALLALMVTSPVSSFLLLACKPQGMALVGLRYLKRLNGRSVVRLLAVVGASFLVWGFWPAHMWGVVGMGHNLSPFPLGLPFAGAILVWEWRRGFKRDWPLCFASLLISPYFWHVSFLPLVCCFIKETDSWRWWAVAVVLSWAFVFLLKVGR